MPLEVELLGYTVILCLVLWGPTKWFSIAAVLFSIPLSQAGGFWLLTPSPTFGIYFCVNSLPHGQGVVTHCGCHIVSC